MSSELHDKPEATKTSEISDKPEVTETSEISDKPEATKTSEISDKPEATKTPQILLVEWAVENKLITEEINLLKLMIDAGWTTIDQVKNEFTMSDIPESIPKRFETRLMKAVRGLQGLAEPVAVTEMVAVTEVNVHYHYYKVSYSSPYKFPRYGLYGLGYY